MRFLCISLLALFFIALSAPALADDIADQRARLANQRIQLEEERRARAEAEAERLREAASEPVNEPAIERATVNENANPASTPDSQELVNDVSAERMEMSRALEQLRELGALRDAGYVTDQEFEQLKKKILDAAL